MDTHRVILHSDMNAFYASVEQAEHPGLRGLPLIVGGDEEARHGIVLTASYEAKRRGVKTGSTLWQARRVCPDATIVPPDYRLYRRYSLMARTLYNQYTDLVEPFGPDEAWLDVTDSLHLMGRDPLLIAQEISERVRTELGVTVSIGVSWNKVFAKFGSDYRKPDGLTVITPRNAEDLVWPAPVSDLIYVGPATTRKLNHLGIHTIGQLALADGALIRRRLGKMGTMVQRFAQGRDQSPVRCLDERICDVEREVKSVGNANTLPFDVDDERTGRQVVWLMGESVAQRLRALGLMCRTVGIFARDAGTLWGRSAQVGLERPTDITAEICQAAARLLCQGWDLRHEPVRAIGVRASNLVPTVGPVQLDLFGLEEERLRQRGLDQTIDALRSRFGNHAVRHLSELADPRLASMDPERDNTTHPVSFFA